VTRARVIAVVAVLAVLGVAYFLRSPAPPVARAAPRPLAAPAISAGRVGGLLPDVTLRGRVTEAQARSLRPAVVMLVAPSCDCLRAVRQVVTEAARVRVVTYVVEAGTSLDQAQSLALQAGGDVGPYADPDGVLARTYGLRSSAALVLVRDDGVVTQVVAAVSPSLRLATALRGLVPNGR
jgi:hypothetical protein